MAILKKDLERLNSIYKALKQQRQPTLEGWKYISKYIDPAYGDMDEDSVPRPAELPDNEKLVDGTIRYYSHIFATGIEGYTCSSKSDFFALRPENNELMDNELVTEGLQARQRIIYKTLSQSAFYDSILPSMRSFGDLGSTVMIMGVEDSEIYYSFVPAYQCQAMKNPTTGRTDVLFRTIWLTKSDAIRIWGENNIPEDVRKEKDEMKYHRFMQLFCPRGKYDLEVDNEYEYLEIVWSYEHPDAPCFVGGDHHQRFLVCTFADSMDGVSNFAWGTGSPGQRQYQTAKALNVNLSDQWKAARLQAIPMIKKTEGLHVDIKPGGFVDIPPGGDIAPMQMSSDISWTVATAQRLLQLAKADYFVDFFLMLSQYQGNVNTATLAQGLQNEQVNMMTSFLDRLAKRFFVPIIEYTYYKLEELGRFPQTVNIDFSQIRIDYISPLYMLQRQAVELTPSMQVIQEALQLAQVDQSILAYVDLASYIKVSREARNADARIIRSDEKAKEILQVQAQSRQQVYDDQKQIEQQKADAQTTAANANAEKAQNQNRFANIRVR